MGPPFVGNPEAPESTYFLSANRNKESIALDLKSADGRTTLTELVRRADVLVENFRTGVLGRPGFPVAQLHELNPRLVVLSISGFGHDGPEGGRSGYDQIAQGEAGLMSVTGSGPGDVQRVGVPIADLVAGMNGAYGVLAALHERERTGLGTVVRTSLLAGVIGIHGFQGTAWTVAGQVGTAQGNHHPSISPYGLFRCRGGAVQISCGSESLVFFHAGHAVPAVYALVTGVGVQVPLGHARPGSHESGAAASRQFGRARVVYRLGHFARILVLPDPDCEPAHRGELGVGVAVATGHAAELQTAEVRVGLGQVAVLGTGIRATHSAAVLPS